jgi:uncharacterized RDD family membrane protein YckC
MSAPLPELSVDSVTGIDVSLPVAGPGARSYAFLIDWLIRLLLALAWYSAATVIYNGDLSLAPPAETDAHWFAAVLAPALAIYFLYHYVLELLMAGRTPGKRMAGVSIISRDGSTPSVGALLTRNVFRLIDSLPLFYGLGLIAVVVTQEHRRIGDMAAGTLLVYDTPALYTPALYTPGAAGNLVADPRRDAVAAELVSELLERWPLLTAEARRELALRLLVRQGVQTDGLRDADEATLHARLEGLMATPVQRAT